MARKKRRGRRIIIALLFIIAAAIGAGMGYISHLDSKIQRPDENEFSKKNIQINEGDLKKEGYHNIAIFGLDARDATLTQGNRSDSIMIASINNKTNDVKLVSIFRDTLVNIPGHGYDKLTHAYSFGGPELALSTLNTNFDLDITDFITVNFSVTEKIIDHMGGITIDVQPSEVKYVNGYVGSLAKEGADTKVAYISGSGEQVLTGSQAVAYARIRYTAGGDYRRAQRQRIVIDAALKKAKTQDLATINNIIESVAGDISTNLTLTDIFGLAKDVFSYEMADSIGFPYHTKNSKVFTQNSPNLKTAVNIPTMLSEDLKTLHYELFNKGTPSTVQAPSDSMLPEDYDKTAVSPEDIVAGEEDYTPSAAVETINQELKAKLGL